MLRVCDGPCGEEWTVGMGASGKEGAEYRLDPQWLMTAFVVELCLKLPVTTSQSQSAIPLGTVSTAVCGE